MAQHTWPMRLGLAGCLGTLAGVLAPVVLADASWAVIRTYLAQGIVGLWASAVLAAVLGVVFLAGLTGRRDPVSVASIGLGAGCILVLATAHWALVIDASLVYELQAGDVFRWHRWLTLASGLAIPLASAWASVRLGVWQQAEA